MMKRQIALLLGVAVLLVSLSALVGGAAGIFLSQRLVTQDLSVSRGANVHVGTGTSYLPTLTIASPNGRIILPQKNDAAAPTLAFGDGDTGFYEVVDDVVYFSVGGTARIQLGSTFGGIVQRSPVIWDNAGSATNASLFFAGDGNTGIYSPVADQFAITTGGTQRVLINATGEMEVKFGLIPAHKTINPCGSGFGEGAIFYNGSSHYWCGCDNNGDDINITDGSACF